MNNQEQEYVAVEMVKDGRYYLINLIDKKGTRYPIAMLPTEGEALHTKQVEERRYLGASNKIKDTKD